MIDEVDLFHDLVGVQVAGWVGEVLGDAGSGAKRGAGGKGRPATPAVIVLCILLPLCAPGPTRPSNDPFVAGIIVVDVRPSGFVVFIDASLMFLFLFNSLQSDITLTNVNLSIDLC